MTHDTYQVVFGFGNINVIWAKFLHIDFQCSLVVQLHLVHRHRQHNQSLICVVFWNFIL